MQQNPSYLNMSWFYCRTRQRVFVWTGHIRRYRNNNRSKSISFQSSNWVTQDNYFSNVYWFKVLQEIKHLFVLFAVLTQIAVTLQYIISRHKRKVVLREVNLTNSFDDVNASPWSNLLDVHFPCTVINPILLPVQSL